MDLLIVLAVLAGLVAFDLVALRFGADSRGWTRRDERGGTWSA